MYSDAFFRRVTEAIKANGTYSARQNSWTIGVPNLEAIIRDLFKESGHEGFPSWSEVLEEGERQGFWEVNNDHDFVTDLVVIKPIFGRY